MRILIIQPIVHMPADMGSMAEALEKQAISKLGKKKWQENQKKIAKFWNEVESAIDRLDLDFKKVRIYQDGLPCSGEFAMKIINEAAEKGSRNYQIIKKLMAKGARVEMTESRELLLKEYNYAKEYTKSKETLKKAMKEYEKAKDELIKERDSFIAERINSTLKDSETGILFIGAHHNVKPKLAEDIEVKELD